VAVMVLLARYVFSQSPQALGQWPDGDAGLTATVGAMTAVPSQEPLPGALLWRSRQFRSLAAGMALGLFAQIGLLALLFSLLVPLWGPALAGWAMGGATACAVGGRLAVARCMPVGLDRRWVACIAYAVQCLGTLLLLAAAPQQTAVILLGVALFGSGIGNATSLPPLIAQVEFAKADVQRVVALIVAMAQATYALAPAVFGAVLLLGQVQHTLPASVGNGATGVLVFAAAVQCLAMLCFAWGRKKPS
jgi:hypothetical protein